ncbi:type IV toxin-antitoxin system AbiEi family antitoxin domain-containing protein [Kribbella sp. CA-294648]|uniref:type IV toxin-antitoxin system AbiEi family antitoxin domain-containing protein n=1 Tax=Kribbella sp. CA-294648 TaxID=3239948 RepID=UPI003D93CBF0
MNKKLQRVAGERGGWFSRADALEAGYTASELRLRLRRGQWERLCRDVYFEPAAWPEDELPWARTERMHTLMARAAIRRMGAGVVISHQSATLLHGLPDWGLDHRRVQLTKTAGRSRSDRTVQIHRAVLAPDDVGELLGLPLTVPARAVVETTCTSSYEVGVVLSDAALRAGLVTSEQLIRMAKRLEHWPGSPAAQAAVAFASGTSESVGESRLRVLMANEGLPSPKSQVEIHDATGRLLGRVDFLLLGHLIVEFDGALKYDNSKALVAEKRREDRLRELGYSFARVTWADLDRPHETGARLRRLLAVPNLAP